MKHLPLVALAALMFCSCGQNRVNPIDGKAIDANAGKHPLSKSDPRSLLNYPTILLLSAKYNLSAKNTVRIITHFESRFSIGLRTGIEFHTTVPVSFNQYEEGTPTLQEDEAYFTAEALRYGLQTATIAALITDFYLLSGTNREFPETGQ